MELQIFEKQLPLRAYPQDKLNEVLIMQFLPFISNLLSLTDKKSADRLELALPAIKEQCIGMGFDQIKRMFEMYADSKLSIEPIPNYFDRVLLGKIVNEYKSLNRNKPKPKIEEKKPALDMDKVIEKTYSEYKKTGELPSVITHIYRYLFKKGKLPEHTIEYRHNIANKAKILAKRMAKNDARSSISKHRQLKGVLNSITNGENINHICQRIIIKQYFETYENTTD